MNIGDLVEYNGELWVAELHNREMRTRQLTRQNTRIWVPDDLDKTSPETCRVQCNIPSSWPFLPVKGNKGWALKVLIPIRRLELKWGDWVQRTPGTIFVNPDLRLRMGEVLIITCTYSTPVKVSIRPSFGTVKERQDRATPPPQVEVTFFDRLLNDDPD